MAGLRATVSTPSDITVNTGPTTLLQLVAPANQRLVIKKIVVTWAGSNTGTIEVETQTTAGTMTSATPITINGASETIQATAQHTATAEPTGGNTLAFYSDDTSIYEVWPPGEGIVVAGGTRVGIVATTSASTVLRAYVEFEE